MNEQATEQHDAFREQRESSLFWLRRYQEELTILALLEGILPAFVRRRYRIVSIYRVPHTSKCSLSLVPAETAPDDLAATNALHADVDKLFGFLLGKRQANGDTPERPTRDVTSYGTIRYEFTLTGLTGFEEGLGVVIGDLPAGSACRITKVSKGKREVEEFEYEMVCDDEAPESVPIEDVKEVAQQ